MPKFAANLTTMFTELPFSERFAAAREVGFPAVECQYPYAFPIAEVSQWLKQEGLEFVLLNTPPGDEEAGESGLAALPGRESDFRALFELALEYATGLGAGMIHLLAGVVPDGTSVEACETTFVANVGWAADLARKQGVRILLEPLNTQDVPGYLHSRSGHTRRLIEAVDRDNVRMQFDFYHLQIMEGNLGQGLRTHLDVIGHIQFSSVPRSLRTTIRRGEHAVSVRFARRARLRRLGRCRVRRQDNHPGGYELGCRLRSRARTWLPVTG